jgi:hypothetical protein
MNGGGPGHNDHYPDGHHVYCVKADATQSKVDFYQTGAFTAMIPEIEPVGRAIQRWVVEDL